MASIIRLPESHFIRSLQSALISSQRHLKLALIGAISVSILLMFIDLAVNTDQYQRDLRTYYLAGKAFEAGADPYDLVELSRQAGGRVQLPFVYPPYSLPAISFLAGMTFESVFFLFLLAKGVALGILFWTWKHWFIPDFGILFGLFALLAFNAAILIDIRVGNISVFEQLLIWIGFGLFLKQKWLGFGLVIVIASSLKLVPLAFLALLVVPRDRIARFYMVGFVVLFIFAQWVSYLSNPDLYLSFLGSVTGFNERGAINPSVHSLIQDLGDLLRDRAAIDISSQARTTIVGIISLGAILMTVKAVAARLDDDWHSLSNFAIFSSCILFVLVMPRMKTYSYILVLVPAFRSLIAQNVPDRLHSLLSRAGKRGPLVVICILSTASLATYGASSPAAMLVSYSPLFVAVYIWYRYLRSARLEASA